MASRSNSKQRNYYPLFFDITDRRCLVVGGGKVALRKVVMLLQFNAQVTVVSPVVSDALLKLCKEGKIECFERTYVKEDLDNTGLVFACTDNRVVNSRIKEEASQKRIPVNVADSPDICDFIVPSVIRKGNLTIAISTSGELPLLSKKLREKIEETITDDYLEYLRIVGKCRRYLMRTVKEQEKRSAIMQKIDRMDVGDVVVKGFSKIKRILNLPLP